MAGVQTYSAVGRTGAGYTIALLFCTVVTIVATALRPDYINSDISG
jgi:hypothetical protein